MSNLVIVSGDYCSGSTLLFTLFRKTNQYYCLYEPLHEKLPEYLISPLRPIEEQDHHFFVENYFDEFKGFDRARTLLNPEWGHTNLYLAPDSDGGDLYRYFSYLIGTAFGRAPRVMFKENRIAFRLGWIRAHFPHAKLIHIYRDKEHQWKSIVRRGQSHVGRENIGQNNIDFNGFNIGRFCDDLQHIFPELRGENSKSGYERFCKLWERSFAEQKKYSHLSVDYGDLTHDFEATWARICHCVDVNIDAAPLKMFVVPPEKQKDVLSGSSTLGTKVLSVVDRVARKYAKIRLRAEALLDPRH